MAYRRRYFDGEVTSPLIVPEAVTEEKIADEAVTSRKIKDETIKSVDIGAGQVKTEDLADGSVTLSKLGPDVTLTPLPDDAVTTPKIKDGAVTTTKIGDRAVTEDKIREGSVSFMKIKDGAVTTPKIATGAVTTPKIADGDVTPAKLSFTPATRPLTPPITSAEIGTKEVKGVNIDDEAIDTDKLEDNAVEKAKIKDGNVSPSKLEAVDAPADKEVPVYDAATGKFEWKTPYRPCISEPAPGTLWAMFFRGYSWGRVGDLITLQLRCKNIPIPAPEEWAGWQTDFTYDQTKMTLESWAWGDYPEPKLDMGGPQPPNQWFGAQATTAPGPYPSDPGEAGMKLLTLGFRLTAPGIANLSFNPPACKYMDKAAVSYPADTLDASITIV